MRKLSLVCSLAILFLGAWGSSHKSTEFDWSGKVLDIPEINLRVKMEQSYKENRIIYVPYDTAGYYSEVEGNTLIVGHNNTVFQKLEQIPSYINLVTDGKWAKYTLKQNVLLLVDDIDMNEVLSYQGVVLMTCAGEKQADNYSHRLILYYQEE